MLLGFKLFYSILLSQPSFAGFKGILLVLIEFYLNLLGSSLV